jgi:hypothetical protein
MLEHLSPAPMQVRPIRARVAFASLTALLMLLASSIASAQLNGTYYIGGASDPYPSVEAAISDLDAYGVSGPVEFYLRSGYYTPPTGGYVLHAVASMSAENTVTFEPEPDGWVTLDGTLSSAIVTIDGGDYYEIDGSNGWASAAMTVVNRDPNAPVIALVNGATHNVVHDLNAIGSGTSPSNAIVVIGSSTEAVGANSLNTIERNVLGDYNGSIRAAVAYYQEGVSGMPNTDNRIERNDIVNVGVGSDPGFGLYLGAGNASTKVTANQFRNPYKSGWDGDYHGIYFSNPDAFDDSIAGNRMWDMQSSSSTASVIAIEIATSADGSMIELRNNMIAINTWDAAFAAGLYITAAEPADVRACYNSIAITGWAAFASSYGVYLAPGPDLTFRNNIVVDTRSGWVGMANWGLYRPSAGGTLYCDYNLWNHGWDGSSGVASDGGSSYATLVSWRSSGFDLNSREGDPHFVDPWNGDLHVSLSDVTPVEGLGEPVDGCNVDYDGQMRNDAHPDAGADEENFNGGGLRVVAPSGGQEIPVACRAFVRFSANRDLPRVYIEISVDGGAYWTTIATVDDVTAGMNVVTIETPDVETTTGLVRVVSDLNAYENDISDGTFSLVRPVFAITAPNNGEQLIPEDVVSVTWTSSSLPPGYPLEIESSTDGGDTWSTIASNVASPNGVDNAVNWTVPDAPGSNNLVRVSLPYSSSSDASDAPFTILEKPRVTLLSHNGGDRVFAGETETIRWSSLNTTRIRLEYSTDDGATWHNALAGGLIHLDAALLRYDWHVPSIDVASARIRIINDERPRYIDVTDAAFPITIGRLAVTSPNGGEDYELAQPVTVRFDAPHSTRLRLDYSSDGGARWRTISSDVDVSAGSYTFVPEGIPTRRALVRLVDEARVALADISDAPFEIMEPPSIMIYTPGAGEQIVRSTIYPIAWQATRIARVNIDYSASAGAAGTWVRLATNVDAALGSFNWNVPSTVTPSGVIRISEVGGAIVSTSGEFQIVAPAPPVPMVRVLRPNGGEKYTAGDRVVIAWTSANVSTVSLEFSSDAGASWWTIAANIPATKGTYDWTAPAQPSSGYRVKVYSGMTYDASDVNFTIERRIVPSITLLYPNGGEQLTVDSTVFVSWLARDIGGGVTVEYSDDNGATWRQIGTADAAAGMLQWTAPAPPTESALVRVTADGVTDVSDAPFAIVAPVVRSITLITPNGANDVWYEGTDVTVTWTSQNIVTVAIMLSLDDGASWPMILTPSEVASSGAFTWRVPDLGPAELRTLRVKISSADGAPYADESDASFLYRPQIAGIETGSSARGALDLVGAFPNPFAGATALRWEQRATSDVGLRLYAADGSLVRSTALGTLGAGSHELRIEAGDLASGTYVFELRTPNGVARGTMMIVR